MRSIAASVLAGIVFACAPFTARAENNCGSNLVIFSHAQTPAGDRSTPNNNALWCAVDPNPDPDTRLINPGSDAVAVRYIQDLGAGVPTLTAVLDGLGFDHKLIELKRADGTVGVVYDSSVHALAAGSASSGCITATLYDTISDPDMLEPLDVNTFHTIDVETTGC